MTTHCPSFFNKRRLSDKRRYSQLKSMSSLLGLGLRGLVLFILISDSLELIIVLLEILVLLESDEKLCLLSLAVLLTFHSDGLSFDFFELSILVSIAKNG